ncbi:MAG: serine/threonine protein kinase [Candidatus Eremiobacteraeota bacterium]|nr:serine/threonine protein kinase [Candidatus Eremiobacteraeota bacterium]
MEDATVYQAPEVQLQAKELSLDKDYELPGLELQNRLGAGTFGEVWAGVQERTGQKVAVKIFTHPSGLDWEYLKKEVGRLRDVAEHPNIVTLLDADLNHNPAYLVMPILSGGSLSEKVKDGPIEPETAIPWIRQIADALHFIHQKGILHCDLKPGNVLLDAEGRARIVDFGQALDRGAPQSSFGTLGFMAPEQASLEDDVEPSTSWDVYALGATAYNLLTGQIPRVPLASRNQMLSFTDASDRIRFYQATLSSVPLQRIREINPEIDPELAAIIEACLEMNPDQRPESASEVSEDLARYDKKLPLLLKRPWGRKYLAERFFRRNRTAVVLSTLIFLVLLAPPLWTEFNTRPASVDPDTESAFEPGPETAVEGGNPDGASTQGRIHSFLARTGSDAPLPLDKREGAQLAWGLLWVHQASDQINRIELEGQWLGLHCADGRAYLLDRTEGQARQLSGLTALSLRPGAVGLGYKDGRLERRDRSLTSIRRFQPHRASVSSVNFSGDALLSGSLDGDVCSDGELIRHFPAPVLVVAGNARGELGVGTSDKRFVGPGGTKTLPANLSELSYGEQGWSGELVDGRRWRGGKILPPVEGENFVKVGEEESVLLDRPIRQSLRTEDSLYIVSGREIYCYRVEARGTSADPDRPADLLRMEAELMARARLRSDGSLDFMSPGEWANRSKAYQMLLADHRLRCRYRDIP